MPRRRFAVVILAPPALAAEVDLLRRAARVPEPFHVAPHVTLVPPTNVAEADLDEVLRVLRRSAAACRPLELDVGPAATFLPETPTLHLAVGGPDLDRLGTLRGQLRSGPLHRPDVWPFHPHVTISEHAELELIEAGLTALAGVRQRWAAGSIHLLEQRRRDPDAGGPGTSGAEASGTDDSGAEASGTDDSRPEASGTDDSRPEAGRPHWVPVREEPLGGPVVVGRGGVELHLRTVSMVEPAAAALLGVAATVPPVQAGPGPIVVVAERSGNPGVVLAAAVGRLPLGGDVAELDRVVVAEDERGQGIGGRVLVQWCHQAAVRGARAVEAELADGPAARLLAGQGFAELRAGELRALLPFTRKSL